MARDTILFDINETVLNLSALKPKFEAVFGDVGVTATWFSMLLHCSTVCVITNVKTGFAELAGTMLDTVAARRGVQITDEQRNDILSTFANLKPHLDIQQALKTLRTNGYRTVAFSNSSLTLVSNQIANSGLADLFDKIISVEETGSFKPDLNVYHFVANKLDCNIKDLRLIATHDWDTHAALTAGMQAAYIDRMGAPYNPLYKKPNIFGRTMNDIVEQIITEDQA